MLRTSTGLLLATVFTLAACGGSDDQVEPGALNNDSLEALADQGTLPDTMPPAPPETVYTERPTPPPPPPASTPRPRPSPPPAQPTPQPPAAPAARTVASGTAIRTTTIDSVHSRVHRAGETVRVSVASDVVDARGRVVIPSGSVMTLAITEIRAAGSRDGAGTLVMAAREVSIDGKSYPISGSATDFEYELRGRGVGTSEVAKTAGGAAAGAIIGRVIGGKKGTVIGAIGGAAAGAAVADATQDRDIVVTAGKSIVVTLSDEFSVS